MGKILSISAGLVLLASLLAFHGGEDALVQEKINGISFMGNPSPVKADALDPIVALNSNYVTYMPFAYGSFGSGRLRWKDLGWQWWGESYEGTEESIKLAQQQNLQVMIKPQIWFDHGEYTGHFKLDSDADWKVFEAGYEAYILQYAELSEQYELDLFCIGTELDGFIQGRPDFWKDLIEKIKRVYSGKLTYASNWDDYDEVPFWNMLDYIGVDAYFPVCDAQTPSVGQCLKGWESHATALEALSASTKLPILFTEWGYRSTDFCCRKPWDYNERRDFNEGAQANAIEGVFQTFWDKPWFAGGFLWKWIPTHASAGGKGNTKFTPQNKLAEEVIRTYFGAHSGG